MEATHVHIGLAYMYRFVSQKIATLLEKGSTKYENLSTQVARGLFEDCIDDYVHVELGTGTYRLKMYSQGSLLLCRSRLEEVCWVT